MRRCSTSAARAAAAFCFSSNFLFFSHIESINFLSDVENIFDDNVDMSVKLENGHTYVVVVATQKIY